MISVKRVSKIKVDLKPLEPLARAVLGESYDLSLVLCGDKLSHQLNLKFRAKDKPTNVLSFPLAKNTGEMFINLSLTKKEAPLFDRDFETHFIFLFIHGLLHLDGMDHGSKMEQAEKKLLTAWLNEKHRHRIRRGDGGHPRRRRRVEAR